MSAVTPVKTHRHSDSERHQRIELAAAFRLAERFGWTELVWNHITARVPDNPDHFLINPMGIRWDEITASNLIKVDTDGNVVEGEGIVPIAGYVIHSAVHEARPDVNACMHTHTNDGIAVSALTEGLQAVCMEALYFHDNVGYHGFEGVSVNIDERERIAKSLGPNQALILRNHGLLTVGETIGEMFVLMYFLQRACEIQMKVMASNRPWQTVPEEIGKAYGRQTRQPNNETSSFRPGVNEWPALMRLLDDTDPTYRD